MEDVRVNVNTGKSTETSIGTKLTLPWRLDFCLKIDCRRDGVSSYWRPPWCRHGERCSGTDRILFDVFPIGFGLRLGNFESGGFDAPDRGLPVLLGAATSCLP